MRYDGRVSFIKLGNRNYNPDTGKEEYTSDVTVATLPADINYLGLVNQQAIFGNVKDDRLIVRLQRPFCDDFTNVIVNDNVYVAYVSTEHRRNKVFYLELR